MPVIAGEPGDVWVNSTNKILWQFHCNFSNSCGLCIQFANQLGPYWPIPLHHGSLLPWTEVVAPGITCASMGLYDGPITRVRFADGFEASVTPNHPFLTEFGFAPAYALIQGDHVVGRTLPQSGMVDRPDHDDVPARVDEIFDSLRIRFGSLPVVMPVAPEDFHGDGGFFQGEIDVVRPDGPLHDWRETSGPEHPLHLPFQFAAQQAACLSSPGPTELLLECARDATDGGVSGLRDLMSGLIGQLRHLDRGRFGSRTKLDVLLTKSLQHGRFGDPVTLADLERRDPVSVEIRHLIKTYGDRFSGLGFDGGIGQPGGRTHPDARLDQMPPDGGIGHSHDPGDLLDRLSGLVTRNEIRSVELSHYRGPVYDLGTNSTLYMIPNGSFLSNCNCRNVAIRPGAEASPFIDYQQAVAELDRKQQARVMGASNWKLVESGRVKWSDVVTRARVKDFHQVVAERKLTVKQMTAVGIPAYQANQALGRITTPAHAAATAARKTLVEELEAEGLGMAEVRAKLVEILKQRLVARRGRDRAKPRTRDLLATGALTGAIGRLIGTTSPRRPDGDVRDVLRDR